MIYHFKIDFEHKKRKFLNHSVVTKCTTIREIRNDQQTNNRLKRDIDVSFSDPITILKITFISNLPKTMFYSKKELAALIESIDYANRDQCSFFINACEENGFFDLADQIVKRMDPDKHDKTLFDE